MKLPGLILSRREIVIATFKFKHNNFSLIQDYWGSFHCVCQVLCQLVHWAMLSPFWRMCVKLLLCSSVSSFYFLGWFRCIFLQEGEEKDIAWSEHKIWNSKQAVLYFRSLSFEDFYPAEASIFTNSIASQQYVIFFSINSYSSVKSFNFKSLRELGSKNAQEEKETNQNFSFYLSYGAEREEKFTWVIAMWLL